MHGRAQKSRERGKEEENKEIIIGAKLKFCLVHTQPIHEKDAKMNLKTSQNDIFGYWNQSHGEIQKYPSRHLSI